MYEVALVDNLKVTDFNFDYPNMSMERKVTEEWRQFFVAALGYRAEHVYNPANNQGMEETIYSIINVLSSLDLIKTLTHLQLN